MMSEKDWTTLFNAFEEEEPFWEGGDYAEEHDFPDLNLYNWLECDGGRPSYKTIQEFAAHGYDVFCLERDSFGWLGGGVRRKLDPSGKVITFG
jgi:hypothetical protein